MMYQHQLAEPECERAGRAGKCPWCADRWLIRYTSWITLTVSSRC